jgi:hypothetical protein
LTPLFKKLNLAEVRTIHVLNAPAGASVVCGRRRDARMSDECGPGSLTPECDGWQVASQTQRYLGVASQVDCPAPEIDVPSAREYVQLNVPPKVGD